MREILFRGKDIANNWHYGVPLIFTEDYVCITAPHTHNKKVEINTVGQYTGLTDKNGTKIFEGDIAEVYLEVPYLPSQPKTISTVGVVEFNTEKSSYYVVSTSGEEYALCFIDEVIGNIHDNSLEDFGSGS